MRSLLFCLSLAFASVAFAQADLAIVQEPTIPVEGDLVTLTVRFPEGYAGEFLPIFEENFRNFPEIESIEVPPAKKGGDPTVETKVVGTGCSFSAGCEGAREIVVVLSSFRLIGKSIVPKTIRHVVKVQAKQGPAPEFPPVPPVPPVPPGEPLPPKDPPTNLPDDPGTKIGAFTLPAEFVDPQAERDEAMIEALEAIRDKLGQIDAGLAKLQTAAPVSVAAPAVVKSVPVPVVVKPAPSIVDVNPGHWSVASARDEWHASKPEAIAHLRSTHAAKAAQFEPLENLTLDQILTLHDDAHEGRSSGSAFVSTPVARYAAPVRMNAGGCPGGVCPTGGSSVRRGLFGFRR
jgi:hypothetical protein